MLNFNEAGELVSSGQPGSQVAAEAVPEQFTWVYSSHGELKADKDGVVIHCKLYEPDSKEGNSLKEITRFDLAEYVQTYGELRTDLDILDLGYWSQIGDDVLDTSYEPPTYSWREERDERRRAEEAEELKRQAELDKWIEEREADRL